MRATLSLAPLLLLAAALPAYAQSPQQTVQAAVTAELEASRNDHSLWRYRDEEKTPHPIVSIVVQTTHGSLKEKVEQNGRPLSPDEAESERRRIQNFIHDPALQQKQKRDGEHDDRSAEKLLNLLPKAFLWKQAGEQGDLVSLSFSPNPNFDPPDIESRVLAAMTGTLVIDKAQHRIRTIKGALTHDVNIGYGLLGKLRQGGTFDVERRQIAPNVWQITETHVHIDGRALLFKTIGQQTDEVQSHFTPVPPSTTLDQAVNLLSEPK